MRYISNVLLLAVLLVSVANGAKPVHVIPDGSKVFIAPMEGNLHGFIAAEVIKQKLPFIVTTDDKEADFVLTGMSVQGDNKWFNSVWGAKTRTKAMFSLSMPKPNRSSGLAKLVIGRCSTVVFIEEDYERWQTESSRA